MQCRKKAVLVIASVIAAIAVFACGTFLAVTKGPELLRLKSGSLHSGSGAEAAAYPVGVTSDSDYAYAKAGYRNAYDCLMAADGFLYGMDYFVFGSNIDAPWALGYNEFFPTREPAFSENTVRKDFYNIKALGFNVVNIWLFDSMCGVKFDHDTGFVSGLDAALCSNLVKALEAARAVDLKVVVSIQMQSSFKSDCAPLKEGYTPDSIIQKYLRFYWDADARQAYMDNAIIPLCENVLKYYQDTVIICDLTVENGTGWIDDDEIGRSQFGEGTTSENMEAFVTAMNRSVKSVMPNMMTSTEDVTIKDVGWHWNDTGIDLHGVNMYNDYGDLRPVSYYYSNTPMYVGEANLAGGHQAINIPNLENLMKNQLRFFTEAKKGGYMGCFYFSWTSGGGFYTMGDGEPAGLRPLAVRFYNLLNDMKNEYHGTSKPDQPALLFNNGGKSVYWVGGRGMTRFKLERSLNGGKTWTVVSDQLSDGENGCTMMANGIMTYQDNGVKAGEKFMHRVTAYNEETGVSSVSLPNNEAEFYVPPELIIDGSFESVAEFGDYPKDTMEKQQAGTGWARTQGNVAVIANDKAYDGKNSLYVDVANGIGENGWAKLTQKIKVTPGARYRLTGHSFTPDSTYHLSLAAYTCDSVYLNGSYQDEASDEWQELACDFNAPSDGYVVIMVTIASGRYPICWLDDVSLKEIR